MNAIAEIGIGLKVVNVCRQLQFSREKELQSNPTTKTKFPLELQKRRFYNHTKPFTHEDYANDIEFSKEYWEIKRNNFIPKITWSILRECPPYNLRKRKCYLCLNEKLEINSYKGNNLLNKISELIKCRIKVQAPKQTYVITT